MSINALQSRIRTLQSDIKRISKDIENEDKKIVNETKKINSTHKSIGKNTSMSSLKSKARTMDSAAEKAGKASKKKSELQEKLSKKQAELQKAQNELQNEQNKAYNKAVERQNQLIKDQQKAVNEMVSGIQTNSMDKEYDFFVSHASEDKEEIARPLAEVLREKGARVWYDNFTLTVGDSLRKSIDMGLANSTYGIVILSPIYFKKFWTGEELNGLFARQEDGRKVILPVWHNISKDEVKRNSPILADMLAFRTADYTVEELVSEFMKFIRDDE